MNLPSPALIQEAPAANILALVYTGAILAAEMVVVRVVSALLMAFVVGAAMLWLFRREEQVRQGSFIADSAPASTVTGRGSTAVFRSFTFTPKAGRYAKIGQGNGQECGYTLHEPIDCPEQPTLFSLLSTKLRARYSPRLSDRPQRG